MRATPPQSWRRFLYELLFLGILFFVLQQSLDLIAPSSKHKDNIYWWTTLSTLMTKEGIFDVWTPYPPVFPLLHYGVLHVVTDPAERDLLVTHFFQKTETEETTAAVRTVLTTMESIWSLLNATTLASITFFVFLFTRTMFPLPRAILAAFGFLLFHLTWNGRILLGVSMDQFDFLPILLLLISAHFLLKERPILTGVAIGLGAMTKIFPIILLPIGLFMVRTARERYEIVALVVLTLSLIAAPFLIANSKIFLATYQWTAQRQGWESVWSYDSHHPMRHPFPPMPDARKMQELFLYPYHDAVLTLQDGETVRGHVVSENGSVVFAPLEGGFMRIPKKDIKTMREQAPPASGDIILSLITIALLLLIPWVHRTTLHMPGGMVRCLFLSLLVLLLFSRGVSAYYFLWFTPFLFVLYRPTVAGVIFSVLLVVANAEYITMESGFSWFWPSIFLREGIFAGLALDQLRMLWIHSRQASFFS